MLVSKFIDEMEPRLCYSPGSDRIQVLLEAEAEAIGVEAVDETAASTSLITTHLVCNSCRSTAVLTDTNFHL